MKNKQNKKPEGILAKYKAKKTKGNIAGTGIKTLVDLLVGATVGAGIGAGSGKFALPVGLVLIAGSHYLDEKTGVLRLVGASSIAYGIGKAMLEKQETVSGYELAGKPKGVGDRLSQFKDELITSFYLDKVIGNKSEQKEIEIEEQEQIGAVSIPSLDIFEQNNRNEALRYRAESMPVVENNYEEELAFDLVEEPDLTNI
tara:strand:+ start:1092 stop:1691 length:600 start_codon:yes stop_codon:yes gene_type:complete